MVHFKAWQPSGRTEMWLRDAEFLPSDVPNARIMTYGYNSSIALSQSMAGIDQFAAMLLNHIELERQSPDERARPLIFVCHSLGGICCQAGW